MFNCKGFTNDDLPCKRKVNKDYCHQHKSQDRRDVADMVPSNLKIKSTDIDSTMDLYSYKSLPIIRSDILYRDSLVTILRPEVKKGILIFTNYIQPDRLESICKIGLKTGKQLKAEGVELDRSVYHPFIFFRAPYYVSNTIDYNIDNEIDNLYGSDQHKFENRVYIRVDPDSTYVFSSEIRANYIYKNNDTKEKEIHNEIFNSKKTLTKYFKIIKENEKRKGIFYNLFSSERTHDTLFKEYPFDNNPINRHSEILVGIPILEPSYFVKCT